jgi:predicted dehydrogenase
MLLFALVFVVQASSLNDRSLRVATMSGVEVGFIGAGYMGQLAHLWNYHHIDDCNVIGLAEPRQQLAEQVAKRFDINTVYQNHEELLAESDPDAIVAILDYSYYHHVLPDILREGIPLFSEKPLTRSISSAEEVVSTGNKHDGLHMVGYHKRSDPAVEYAKELINEWQETGEYGEMNLVRITIPPGDGRGGIHRPIETDETPPEQPVDSLPDSLDGEAKDVFDSFLPYYCHQINLLRWVMGDYELTFADPTGTLILTESTDGTCGVIEMGPYSTSNDWQESLFVAFDEAYIQVNFPAPLSRQQSGDIEIWTDGDDDSRLVRPTLPNTSAMHQQAENFLAAVNGERPVPCNASEALKDIRIARDYIKQLQKHDGFEWVHLPFG